MSKNLILLPSGNRALSDSRGEGINSISWWESRHIKSGKQLMEVIVGDYLPQFRWKVILKFQDEPLSEINMPVQRKKYKPCI